jgi:SAM-dependent methyltransferase
MPVPEPHRHRREAESFGADPDRYDRVKRAYPAALVQRIISASPGRHVLDVGCGTGVEARQFQAAGCTVLGVDPDVRMAEFARRGGVAVEVATFEAWDPAGRKFDAVIAGTTWHWVDPVAGAAKAAQVLRPGGLIAPFSIEAQPAGMRAMGHPVVFIRGLWLRATSWDRWVKLFADRGYAAIAPGWPGEEPTVQAARASPAANPGRGVGDVSEHYARIAGDCSARPMLIGHGLGGLLALTLGPRTHAAGVIAIEAVLVSAMALTRRPAPGADAAALTRGEFRAVYGGAVSREESDRLYEQWAIPAPRWAWHDPVTPGPVMPRRGQQATNSSRGPVLLVASGESARPGTAPDASGERRLLVAGTDLVIFPDRGPSLTIDGGWRPVAESCLSWMDAHEL